MEAEKRARSKAVETRQMDDEKNLIEYLNLYSTGADPRTGQTAGQMDPYLCAIGSRPRRAPLETRLVA